MSQAAPYDYRGARDDVFASTLPGPLRLLVLALIESMPECRPSVATLAQRCGVERKTVLRGLARLEQLGVISVTRALGARSLYRLQPVPLWRTGPLLVPVPTEQGTGTNEGIGPVPFEAQTGPILGPEAEKQIQKADRKQCAPTGPIVTPVPESHRFGEAAPNALGPSKRDREASSRADALGTLRHRYSPDFGPTLANQARGRELGLTDAEIWQRWDETRDKFYDARFDDDERQFNRELAWAKSAKEQRSFKTQRDREAFEMPGRERRV